MMTTKRKNQKNQPRALTKTAKPKQPLIEHLQELKRRLFIVAAVIVVGSVAAYASETKLVKLLLKPSHGQEFIYTSPLGGMNFLFGVCLQLGLVLATPVIIYNLLAFLKPLMRYTTHRYLIVSSIAATITAAGGLVFGYCIGLPSALHFLLHQFTTVQVKPLITIQSYMSFVAVYLLGSALMFQLPLLILFINRIKPLKPSQMFKYERHAIAGSFIIAFIMNPTPNIIDQLLVVVPIIVMYQLSILMLWVANRKGVNNVQTLVKADIARQTARLERQVQVTERQVVQTVEDVIAPVLPMSIGPTRRSFDGITQPRRSYQQLNQRNVIQ